MSSLPENSTIITNSASSSLQEAKELTVDPVSSSVSAYDKISQLDSMSVTLNRTGSSGTFGEEESISEAMNEETSQITEDYNSSDYITSGERAYLAEGLTTSSYMGNQISRYNFVHGMPFQFTPETDRRRKVTNSDGSSTGAVDGYGRTFAKDYVANLPIATFLPGLPKFLVGSNPFEVSNEERNAWLPAFFSDSDLDFSESLLNIDQGSGQSLDYFTLDPTPVHYYEYVNSLCSASAKNMGIGSMKMSLGTDQNVTLENINWSKYNRDVDQFSVLADITGFETAAVCFAFDPQSSVTDNYSNATRTSALESQVKSVSSKAQELTFLLGTAGMTEDMDISDAIPMLDELSENPNNVFTRLFSTGSKTLLSGANLRFPQIWDSSEGGTNSITLEMKFVSPYDDAYSKWRHVLVPFWHIFALVAPRSTSPTTFQSPFLVRSYSKGYYSVDNGIIESMTVKKFGDGTMISANGIPTMLEISISIRPLYSALSMSRFTDINNFFANTALIDLIGTMSGVNMNRLSLDQVIGMYGLSIFENVTNWPGRFMETIGQNVRNTFERVTGFR